MLLNKRGIALSMVILTAIVMAIAAYSALTVAIARVRRPGPLSVEKLQAQFSAEGGITWAMQRLYEDPNWYSLAGEDWNGTAGVPDLVLNGMDIDIIMPCCVDASGDCGECDPGVSRTLQAKVIY